MNREELLQASEVLKAAAEGKPIQWKIKDKLVVWSDARVDNTEINFNFGDYDYRIKPEARYIPYPDLSSFVDQGYSKRKNKSLILKAHNDQPIGQIVQMSIGCVDVRYYDKKKNDSEIIEFSYQQLLDNCVWAEDNTPCGIRVNDNK